MQHSETKKALFTQPFPLSCGACFRSIGSFSNSCRLLIFWLIVLYGLLFLCVSYFFLAAMENRMAGAALSEKNGGILSLFLASILISINWFVYIWAVNHGFLLEASLGYYINPLVSVLLGILFLKEKLNRLQLVAVSIAAAGVIISAFQYGSIPYVALLLAFSFGLYGLSKKEQACRAPSA